MESATAGPTIQQFFGDSGYLRFYGEKRRRVTRLRLLEVEPGIPEEAAILPVELVLVFFLFGLDGNGAVPRFFAASFSGCLVKQQIFSIFVLPEDLLFFWRATNRNCPAW